MTVADLRTNTGTELLYLVLDLPTEKQTFDEYAKAANNISDLMEWSIDVDMLFRGVAARRMGTSSTLRVVRTSMASPWVTILGELAKNSAPIGYGLAGVYAFQKVMHLVMEWQNHRQSLIERSSGAIHSDEANNYAKSQLVSILAEYVRSSAAGGDNQQAAAEFGEDINIGIGNMLQTIGDLPEVKAAELIDPDDPRVRGE